MFTTPASEAINAYDHGYITLHSRIAVPVKSLKKTTFTEKQQDALLVTTVGKLIFNEIFPEDFPYINEPTKQNIKQTPDKYFIFEKGTNVREFIQKIG